MTDAIWDKLSSHGKDIVCMKLKIKELQVNQKWIMFLSGLAGGASSQVIGQFLL